LKLNQIVFKQGDPANNVYLIKEGEFDVIRTIKNAGRKYDELE